jgi:hypothetical protein
MLSRPSLSSAPRSGSGSTCRPRYDLEVEKDRIGAALDDIRPRAPRADANAVVSLNGETFPTS